MKAQHNNLTCSKCGLDLGSYKSKPSQALCFRWLISPDWKLRLPFCTSCEPDASTTQKLALDLKKNKILIQGGEYWSGIESLDEYVASSVCCKRCKKKITEGDGIRQDWSMYHKSCLGVYDSVKNV